MRQDRGERSGGFRPRNFAPVKVGDELDVKIEAVGEKGDGIAKKDGFVLFVPNTKQGDEVKIKITRVLPKVGFAEVVGEKSADSSDSGSEEQQGQAESSSDDSSQGSDEEYGQQDSDNFGEETEEQ